MAFNFDKRRGTIEEVVAARLNAWLGSQLSCSRPATLAETHRAAKSPRIPWRV